MVKPGSLDSLLFISGVEEKGGEGGQTTWDPLEVKSVYTSNCDKIHVIFCLEFDGIRKIFYLGTFMHVSSELWRYSQAKLLSTIMLYGI